MLRVFEFACLAAFLTGLFMVDAWWLLALAGFIGLVSVDRTEQS